MAAKSKSTSATPKTRVRRTQKSQTRYLSKAEIEYRKEKKASQEFSKFLDNRHDSPEMRICGHLLPAKFPSRVALMKEIRRLLGESIAKCKVIPFPVERIRQSKSMEA
jgi:hypothetical protein